MKRFLRAARILVLICGLPLWAAGASWEDELLVTEVWVEDSPVSEGTDILYRGGEVYVPGNFFRSVLEINLAPGTDGSWAGWIYEETNRVELNPAAGTARAGNTEFAMAPRDVIYREGDWYYRTEFIGRVLRLAFEFDYSLLLLRVRPQGGELPVQSEASRARRRRIFDAQQASAPRQADTVRDGSFWQAPFIDLSARYHLSKEADGSRDNFWGYSANAFAVTGGFDTEAYVYDMDNHSPATVALKTSRYQPDGNIFGLFKWFEAGDILSFSNPAVNFAQKGRGFKLSSRAQEESESKTFNIRDALPLGWDVELYRGDELMGYRSAGPDGFFEFTDVPLLLGENRFRLVFYGPQGQRREREINYFFMGGLVDKGAWDVQAGFMEKNKYLVETRKDVPSYSQGYNGQLSAAYGVTDALTFRAAALYDSVPVLEPGGFVRQDKFFASAGAAYSVGGMFFNLQSVYDPRENAASADVSWQTVWQGWDLFAQNIYYDGVLTERNVWGDSRIENDTLFRLNKTLRWNAFSLPVNYSFRRFVTDAQDQQIEHTLGLYKTVWQGWYTALSYQYISGLNGGKWNLLHMDVNRSAPGYSVRADASYDFVYNRLRDVGVSAYKDLTSRLNAGLSYRRASLSDERSSYENRYGGSLNWKTRYGYWSLDAGWSDSRAYYAYVGVNLSLVYDKFARKVHASSDKLYGTGAVSADVFLDENLNGVHDADEKGLENAVIHLTPSAEEPEQTVTDGDGRAFITKMRGYQPYTARLDVNKLDGVFSALHGEEKTVEIRPGQVVYLSYPLSGAGDIEGTVYIKRGGAAEPARGVVLRLADDNTGKEIASKISEFDGYYLFEGLPFGRYRLSADETQMRELGLSAPPAETVSVERNEQITVYDLTVSGQDEEARKPGAEKKMTAHITPEKTSAPQYKEKGV